MADTALHSMTDNTNVEDDDELYVLRSPTTTPTDTRAKTSEVLKSLNKLTADTAPEFTADYILTYDNSASAPKKVLLQKAAPIVLQGGFSNYDPADATTYYWGGKPVVPTTTAQRRKLWIPRAGTITKIYLSMSLTVGGTTETSTISLRLNNTSDTTISAAVDNSAYFEVAATVSVAVAAGDYVEIKWVTPTWATNPTGVNGDVVIVIE